MKKIRGNLWDYVDDGYIVITTNGAVNSRGECVMGRGTALQAKNRYPGLAIRIGNRIKQDGNHVHYFEIVVDDSIHRIITFPVKHHWAEMADLKLIARSVMELVDMMNAIGVGGPRLTRVYLPHPGCNNGGLKWENVRPLLDPYLDDRFTIVDRNA